MATAFDTTTYPLAGDTEPKDEHLVKVDVFDDGSMASRTLSQNEYREIDCVFQPMTKATASTFEAYLRTNKGIEWDLTLDYGSPYTVYRGYIMDEPEVDFSTGLALWSFTFRGQVV